MRATLSNVEILIIDEVSMVSKRLFAYVNWRFQQIKGNKKPFGGISVLAVGDFYQLRPVGKAKPLCVYEEDEEDFWKEHFKMITLTEIMRQKEDLAFAHLLNRIRVKQKTESFSESDKTLLASAVTESKDCPTDVIYIFATNKEVDCHNSKTVRALHKDFVNIDAEDYLQDSRTGKMKKLGAPTKSKKGELVQTIEAAEGVRVMVTRNIDVEDGIVNGTFGKIAKIVTETKAGETRVQKLGLQLDNPKAGQKQRQNQQGASDSLIYIERLEESLSKKGVVRRQFPLKLAFACTSHKVQGMTLQSAVVSLKRIFEPGMAYVALSRTTSLGGLHITDFAENKIYADSEIAAAMQTITTASLSGVMPLLKHVCETDLVEMFKIVHHNTEGLITHINDIKCHPELRLADVLCLTETHLSGSIVTDSIALEGYRVFLRNRHLCYMRFPELAKKEGGGGCNLLQIPCSRRSVSAYTKCH
uniref:ATP-dependent DNA helicase n=1 Tax=Myripristis murdjan TaxID=586833 RepID=A0A667YQ84_9TELE